MSRVLNPQFVPTLFKLGRSVADEPENLNAEGKPKFVECGCCGMLHPTNFSGECRDNDNRFAADTLDEKYGAHGWEEIYEDEDEAE